jgi:hypothetical protein
MGRIITGQTVASTHLDSHGERISPDELRHLFEQWKDVPAGVAHDLSRPPACRTFNVRMEALPDGELALKVDLEVLNEEEFAKFGGFSISFTRRHAQVGDGTVEAEISVNSRQFDFEAVVSEIQSAITPPHTIEVVERVEKGDMLTVTAAIVVIEVFWVLQQTLKGFFNAAGGSLFEAVRRLRRKDESGAATAVQFHLHLHQERRVPVLILVVDPECTAADVRAVNEAATLEMLQTRVAASDVQRAVANLSPGGKVELRVVVDRNGNITYKKEEGA